MKTGNKRKSNPQLIVGYSVYIALLSQSDSAAPTAVVLQNTIGDMLWSRLNTGTYLCHALNGAQPFTDKTIVMINHLGVNGIDCFGAKTSEEYIYVKSRAVAANITTGAFEYTETDGLMNGIYVEIRVYN